MDHIAETQIQPSEKGLSPVIYGTPVTQDEFIPQALSSVDLGRRLTSFDDKLLASRGLQILKETPQNMWGRVNCLPTATLVAINHLRGQRVFGTGDDAELTLGDFYNAGVLAHLNDREVDGQKQKGFPSFHRVSGETYHPFAIAVARRFGVDGAVVTGFKDVRFIPELIKAGCEVIVSMDNLFIPAASAPHLDPNVLSVSKHAEIFHRANAKTGDLVFTDVFNARDGRSWDSRNKEVSQDVVNRYLTCPRRGDNSTRAIVLYDATNKNAQSAISSIPGDAQVIVAPHNPILDYKPGAPLREWNQEIESLWKENGLTQWELVDFIQGQKNH